MSVSIILFFNIIESNKRLEDIKVRKDIKEIMKMYKKEGVKPNFSKVVRRYNCDYRTVKRYYDEEDKPKKPRKKRPSKLDGYRDIIQDKLDWDVPVTEILKYIKKKGYEGQYTILVEYCRTIKADKQKKATVRFETNPGLQAQVDWKERMKMVSKHGEIFEIDSF